MVFKVVLVLPHPLQDTPRLRYDLHMTITL
jgi:hypothetical protein